MLKVEIKLLDSAHQRIDVSGKGYDISETVQKYVFALAEKTTQQFFGYVADQRTSREIEYRMNSKLQNDYECGRIVLVGDTWIETEPLWVDL
jgi:hypothetical protein